MSESAIATRVEDHGFLSLWHRPSPGGVYAPHSLAPAITPRTLLPLWGHGCGVTDAGVTARGGHRHVILCLQ